MNEAVYLPAFRLIIASPDAFVVTVLSSFSISIDTPCKRLGEAMLSFTTNVILYDIGVS